MIAFAEVEFRRSVTLADGAPLSAHEESAARQRAFFGGGGKKQPAPAPDVGPTLPHAVQYLWNWFVEISDGLEFGGMSTPNLTWHGLAAWCDLTRRVLEPWEAATLVRLGFLRAAIASENRKTKKVD